MKYGRLILGIGFLWLSSQAAARSLPVYRNPKADVESRVKDLLGRMTLEEKVLQLCQYTVGPNTNVNNIGEENVELTEGQTAFDTWIHLCDGQIQNKVTVPDYFLKKKR